jgi:hypothetical protein
MTERISLDFNPEDEALVMIESIKLMKPLPQMNPQLFYKLYRDPQCRQELTYLELMNKFKALGIQSNTTFYVIKDNKNPFA